MSTPLVSIVIPCYNYAHYLPECLESIFRQGGDYDLEVIAIDDAAIDNSAEILRKWNDPRLRIITHAKNQGHAMAVTHGFEAARGKYAARIDPDDHYRPNYLSTLAPVLETHPEVGMAYGDASMIDENGVQTAASCDTAHGGQDFLGNELTALLEHHFICAPAALARREAWLAALPVPAHLAFNDMWFNLMLARRWDFCYKNVIVADYRVHSQNWHTRIIKDRSDERSLFWLIDEIYSTPEKTLELEAEKQSVRGRVYGAQYLSLAMKYFGAGMTPDARRCFLRAVRYSPALLLKPGVARYLGASLLGIERYNALKAYTMSAKARSTQRK